MNVLTKLNFMLNIFKTYLKMFTILFVTLITFFQLTQIRTLSASNNLNKTNYTLLRVDNKEGIVLRDENCNKIKTLKKNTILLVASLNFYPTKKCSINGKIYTFNYGGVYTGGSSIRQIGYVYAAEMGDAGPIESNLQSKTINNSIIRDGNCKSVTKIKANTKVNLASSNPAILCSVRGKFYPMYAIKIHGKISYIAGANLQY
jgi:hypothetical protein